MTQEEILRDPAASNKSRHFLGTVDKHEAELLPIELQYWKGKLMEHNISILAPWNLVLHKPLSQETPVLNYQLADDYDRIRKLMAISNDRER